MDLELAGIICIPHVTFHDYRGRPVPEGPPGARIELYVTNRGEKPAYVSGVLLNGRPVDEYRGTLYSREGGRSGYLPELDDGCISWHDTPSLWSEAERFIPPGALAVWTINFSTPLWDSRGEFVLGALDGKGEQVELPVAVAEPQIWLEAVTFLGESVRPDRVVVHVANRSSGHIRCHSLRLWQPKRKEEFTRLHPGPEISRLEPFTGDGRIAPGDQGGFMATVEPLLPSHAAVEVVVEEENGKQRSLWAHLRVKSEVFDISGGWVNDALGESGDCTLFHEAYLKTLKRLYINTAHMGCVPGYNDRIGQGGLYDRYPLKMFGSPKPLERYDDERMLPHIHGVEILGEPQYDTTEPQEVWEALRVYAPTLLPTTVTLSDLRGFAHYAGLSDYPHYDAYRVSAPSADRWLRYQRWPGGVRIGWGAPLEGIGEMSRVLRELSRPMPTAVWSQGPHHNWSVRDGRSRTSPTPEELRSQAYHALGSRITSLYWFNISIRSIVMYRDTLEEMARIGREIRLLDSFYLEGAAYEHRKILKDGEPDWDLSSIAAPSGALLFAHDLAYEPDLEERVFKFSTRAGRFRFRLPEHLRPAADVFAVDADGIRDLEWRGTDEGVELEDRVYVVGIYVASKDARTRRDIEERHRRLMEDESQLNWNPAKHDRDFEQLVDLAPDDVPRSRGGGYYIDGLISALHERMERESRLLAPMYAEGTVYMVDEITCGDRGDWTIGVVSAPHSLLLLAVETGALSDAEHKPAPRRMKIHFELPEERRDAQDLFRIEAGGIGAVEWKKTGMGVEITDDVSLAAVYVAADCGEIRREIEARLSET